MNWQSIEGAPKDGSVFIAARFDAVIRIPRDVYVARFDVMYNTWMGLASDHAGPRSVKPTHWVPMPELRER